MIRTLLLTAAIMLLPTVAFGAEGEATGIAPWAGAGGAGGIIGALLALVWRMVRSQNERENRLLTICEKLLLKEPE